MAKNVPNATACETCRFWSDLVADVLGGEVRALCLEPTQPKFMRHSRYGCAAWKDAPFGAVDELRDEPNPYFEAQGADVMSGATGEGRPR